MLLTCANCKVNFKSKRADKKFCGKHCQILARQVFHESNTECAFCKTPLYRSLADLKNTKSGLSFCDRACKTKAQKLGGITAIMPKHYGTSVEYRHLFTGAELRCTRCGYDEFQCGVEIHHIDKNRKNNAKENLIPLCACCHRGLHNNLWQL